MPLSMLLSLHLLLLPHGFYKLKVSLQCLLLFYKLKVSLQCLLLFDPRVPVPKLKTV